MATIKGHKPKCQCAFCGPGGNATHKTGCQCPVCNKLGGNNMDHKSDCQCPFCEPPNHAPWANTRIEIIMQELLTELGIEFETQKRFGRYQVDIYIPSCQLVIECDGEYWHRFENPRKRSRRDSYIRRQGFSLWHFTGSEINNGCEKRLRRALMH